jgi:spermidine/putrescine-binding protein
MFYLAFGVLVSCGVAFGAEPTGRPALAIGQLQNIQSLPFALMEKECREFSCAPMKEYRSEPFPSSTPLESALTGLPDIVDALAGYYENDLTSLIKQGLIEPLDPIFEELGIDPKTYYPPNVYAAVSSGGKIWAIPHRVQIYVFRYDKKIFDKLGLKSDLTSLDGILTAADKISQEAVPGQKVAGFLATALQGDVAFAAAILLTMDATRVEGNRLFEIIHKHKDSIAGFGVDLFASDHRYAIEVTLLSQVVTGPNMGILALPRSLTATGAPIPEPSLVSFLECFAIRKGTSAKREAAVAFVKWLLKEDTQLRLVEETRLDRPISDSLNYRHIPLAIPVQQSAQFQALLSKTPDYQIILDSIQRSDFACAEPIAGDTPHDEVVKRAEKTREIQRSQGDVAAYLYLFSSIQGTQKDSQELPKKSVAPKKDYAKY